MRRFVIIALAILGAFVGLGYVLMLRSSGPPTHPALGFVGVFPFDSPGGKTRPDLAEQLAERLNSPRAKVVTLPAAKDAQAAAVEAGVRLYVVGLAGDKLHARLHDVTAPAGPRAEAEGKTVDELAAQLRGGILGAAVHERSGTVPER